MTGENTPASKPVDLYEFETAIRAAGHEPSEVTAASRVFSACVMAAGVDLSVRYYGAAWLRPGWFVLAADDDGYGSPAYGTTPEEAIKAAIGGPQDG